MFGGLVNEVERLNTPRADAMRKRLLKSQATRAKRAEKERIKSGTQWQYLEDLMKDELSKVRMFDKYAQEHRDKFAELLQKQKEC